MRGRGALLLIKLAQQSAAGFLAILAFLQLFEHTTYLGRSPQDVHYTDLKSWLQRFRMGFLMHSTLISLGLFS